MKITSKYHLNNYNSIYEYFNSVFGSVVAGAFQIAFHAEMHANDFFYFLKIIFDINTSKRSKKYKPHSILTKKKFKFT
jgi:hypothetical protein